MPTFVVFNRRTKEVYRKFALESAAKRSVSCQNRNADRTAFAMATAREFAALVPTAKASRAKPVKAAKAKAEPEAVQRRMRVVKAKPAAPPKAAAKKPAAKPKRATPRKMPEGLPPAPDMVVKETTPEAQAA